MLGSIGLRWFVKWHSYHLCAPCSAAAPRCDVDGRPRRPSARSPPFMSRALERARSLLCRGLGAAGSHISRPVPPSDVTHSATMAQWPRTRHLTGPRECTPPHEAGEEADMDAGRCRPKPPFALYAGKATPDDGPGWYQSHCHARARSCVACGSLCTASGRSLTSIPARRSKFARFTAPTPVERTVGLRECTADADRYPRFVSARGGWRESNITRTGG